MDKAVVERLVEAVPEGEQRGIEPDVQQAEGS
jgi:hypothetical protein